MRSPGNPRGHRLRRIDALLDRDLGKQIEVGGLTGTLTGVVPVAGRVQLVLVVGGARVFTAAFPGETGVEVWTEGAA